MSKSLRHYKHKHRRNNKTQRLRKMKGGYKVFPDDQTDLHELDTLLDKNDHLLALHSSGTCGHCNRFEPEWKKVVDRLTPHPNMTVAKLGQGATDFMNLHHYRKHNHAVNGVPTIVYYIVNNKPQEYDGERTADKIIEWATKVMADNKLELTIKSNTQDDEYKAPPVESDLAFEPASVPASVPEQVDAFPQAPLPPASTLSKAADTIKATAANVDEKIAAGLDAAKSALTSELNIGSLFSAAPAPAVAEPAPMVAAPTVAAPAFDTNAPAPAFDTNASAPDASAVDTPNANVPPVPSLVGGRSKNKKSKKSKKSKQSKQSKQSKKSKKSKKQSQ